MPEHDNTFPVTSNPEDAECFHLSLPAETREKRMSLKMMKSTHWEAAGILQKKDGPDHSMGKEIPAADLYDNAAKYRFISETHRIKHKIGVESASLFYGCAPVCDTSGTKEDQ